MGIFEGSVGTDAHSSVFIDRSISYTSTADTYQGTFYFTGLDVGLISTKALDILRKASASGATHYADGQHKACDNDTRISIRDDVSKWLKDKEGRHIYWLNGKAGYGKSTVARTVTEMCAGHAPKRLVASFFFSRDKEDRRNALRFFPTIALQLITLVPSLETTILGTVLRSTESIQTTSLPVQFQMLVIDPLLGLKKLSSPVVIVIDALDECEDPMLAAEIITVLTGGFHSHRDLPLQIFISSRPDEAIRERMNHPNIESMVRSFSLSDISARDDIHVFLRRRFDNIRDRRRDYMPSMWPTETEVQTLADKSSGLFIYASVILNFIDTDKKHPSEQLKIILNIKDVSDATSPLEPLHQLYKQILTSPYTERHTRSVVETIIGLFNPLPPSELDRLLGLEDGVCRFALRGLHAVFFVPNEPGTSVRVFHASVYEFLTSPGCPVEFSVNLQARHTEIINLCLNVMMKGLKRDIYDMDVDNTSGRNSQGQSNIDTTNRRYKREESLSGALRYSCRYWAKHLSLARPTPTIMHHLEKFGSTLILNWIEALGLAGDLDSAIPSLQDARRWLQNNQNPFNRSIDLLQLFSDTETLISSSFDAISASPLEVYNSALLMMPRDSMLFDKYLHELEETKRRLDVALQRVRNARLKRSL